MKIKKKNKRKERRIPDQRSKGSKKGKLMFPKLVCEQGFDCACDCNYSCISRIYLQFLTTSRNATKPQDQGFGDVYDQNDSHIGIFIGNLWKYQ